MNDRLEIKDFPLSSLVPLLGSGLDEGRESEGQNGRGRSRILRNRKAAILYPRCAWPQELRAQHDLWLITG